MQKKDPQFLVSQWLQRKEDLGHYHTLIAELEDQDQPFYRNFMRMSPVLLAELEQGLIPALKRGRTWLINSELFVFLIFFSFFFIHSASKDLVH